MPLSAFTWTPQFTFKVGSEHNTQRTEMESGKIATRAKWSESRKRFHLVFNGVSTTVKTAIVDFFDARNGGYESFHFTDPNESTDTSYDTITAATIAFVSGSPDTITDSGSGLAVFVAGQSIKVSGATNTANNGTHKIATGGVAAGTLTLTSSTSLTNESAGNSITIINKYSVRFLEDTLEVEAVASNLWRMEFDFLEAV